MGPDTGENTHCESMTGTNRPEDERGDNIQDSEGTVVCGLELLKFEWPKNPTSVQGVTTWYLSEYRKTSFY